MGTHPIFESDFDCLTDSWMDDKLEYSIKACSTEAPGYPAENVLNFNTIGWRSADLCDFPQSIICKLNAECSLRKVQLLGHNYMIPQRVVLYVGNFHNKYEKHIWKKIGFVTFSDNSKTSYKQRELKTINLKDMDISGQYVKFVVFQNHDNKKNIFNQVGLDYIYITGEPKPEADPAAAELASKYLENAGKKNGDVRYGGGKGKAKQTGDRETEMMLAKMKEEKKFAEDKEDFDLAAALKDTIGACTTLSEQIWMCDVQKSEKVSEEKYDEAKGLKIRRDELKLRRDRLIDENLYKFGFNADYFLSNDQRSSKSSISTERQSKYSQEDNGYLEVSPKASVSNGYEEQQPPYTDRRDDKRSIVDFSADNEIVVAPLYEYDTDDADEIAREHAIYHNQTVSHDERGINNHGKTFQEILDEELKKENQRNPNANQDDFIDIDDKKRRENEQYISLFGEKFVIDAISKKHSQRLSAVDQLKEIIHSKMNETDNREEQRDYVRGANHFIGQFLQDGVKEVQAAGIELIPLIIQYCTMHYGTQADVNYILEINLPILLKKSAEAVPNLVGDLPKQVKPNEILNATVNIGTLESVQRTPLYYTKVFTPFATEAQKRTNPTSRNKKENILTPKQTYARLEIVEKIIRTQQTLLAKHWDTEKYFFATFEMVEIGLKHHNNCVREKARGIIKFMYRVNDEKTRDMFDIIIQNDRDKQIRDKTVQDIHDDFDKIDGKPTKKELEAKQKQAEAAEAARKAAEVKELQRKLEEVKELNRQAQESKNALKQAPDPSSRIPGSNPKESVISDSTASVDESNDKSCIFCGEYNENFDGAGLDVHYWKHCPMLKRCGRCKMVVEVSSYSAHLLDECEQKAKYVECEKCNEAVEAENLKEHQLNKKICFPKRPGKVRGKPKRNNKNGLGSLYIMSRPM